MSKTAGTPGCVIFLIDESAGMGSAPTLPGRSQSLQQDSEKSRSERVATTLNSWLRRTADTSACDIAIVGYRSTPQGEPDVGSRWAGSLAGRDFVSAREAQTQFVRMETRTRKSSAGGGTSVDFPIWYDPEPAGEACQVTGWKKVKELLETWSASVQGEIACPMIIHISGSASADGNPMRVIDDILRYSTPAGAPVVVQVSLSKAKSAPPFPYPSNRHYLPVGPAKDLFVRCSPVPGEWKAELTGAKYRMNDRSVCLLYNASPVDLAVLMNVVEHQVAGLGSATEEPTEDAPSTQVEVDSNVAETNEQLTDAPESFPEVSDAIVESSFEDDLDEEEPSGPVPKLLLLVVDRSLRDPYEGGLTNSWRTTQNNVNDLLENLSKDPLGTMDVSLILYGADDQHETQVLPGFDNLPDDSQWIQDQLLADYDVAEEEYIEQIPNGIGGILSLTKKRKMFVQLEPTHSAPPSDAFRQAKSIIDEWSSQKESWNQPSVVLFHFTRADVSPADMAAAADELSGTRADSVNVYHWITTDDPHPSVVYPDSDDLLNTDSLKAIFEATGPLLGAIELAEKYPQFIQETSRGLVVNAKFDHLSESLSLT